eukprot:4656688-Amphidinium_carterae.1
MIAKGAAPTNMEKRLTIILRPTFSQKLVGPKRKCTKATRGKCYSKTCANLGTKHKTALIVFVARSARGAEEKGGGKQRAVDAQRE